MRRILRFTLRFAVVVVAVFVLWTAVFNVLLNTSALSKALNGAQHDVTIHHGVAWSLWPTKLYVHDLEIVGQDSHVEWMIAADRAEATFDLGGLLEKRLTLLDTKTRGFAFRMRQTRALDALCPMQTLPQLPGLANAGGSIEECLRQRDTSKKPGAPSKPENLWKVDLRSIVAEQVREVWVESQRFAGDAALNGDFYFWPTQRLGVKNLAFHVDKGSLFSGRKPMINTIQARGEAVLLPVNLADRSGSLLEKLSVTATVGLDLVSVGFLNDQLTGPAGVTFDDGNIGFQGRMKIVGGVIRPGSSVEISARDVRARMLDHVALGSGRVSWRLGTEEAGVLEAVLDEFRLEYVDDANAPIIGEGCSLVLSTKGALVTEPFQITAARFQLTRATVSDLTRFNRYLPPAERLKIKSGSAILSGTFAVGATESHEAAEVSLSFDNVLVGWKEFDARIAGDIHAVGGLNIAPTPHLSLTRVSFNLHDGSITAGQDRYATGMRISGVAALRSVAFARLQEELLSKLVLDARVNGNIGNLRALNKHLMTTPWLAFEQGGGHVAGHLRMAGGRLQNGSSIDATSDELVARIFDHHARGAAHVAWQLDEGDDGTGKLTAEIDHFDLRRIGFQQTHVRGEAMRVALDTKGRDLNRPFAIVGARLSIDKATVPDLTFYNTYIPPSMQLLIASGSATVSAELDARSMDGDATGTLSLKADSVLVQWRDFDILGSVSVEGGIKSADINHGTFQIDGTKLRMQDVSVRAPNKPDEPVVTGWWGEVVLSDATFHLDGPVAVEGTVTTHLRDVRPLLTIYGADAGLPHFAYGILSAKDTRGSCRLRLGEQKLLVQDVNLAGGGLRARAQARFDEKGAYAAALLGYGFIAVSADLDNGKTHFNVLNQPTKEFEAREKAFRESVEVTD